MGANADKLLGKPSDGDAGCINHEADGALQGHANQLVNLEAR